MTLVDSSLFDLDESEAQAIVASLNAHFAADGLDFRVLYQSAGTSVEKARRDCTPLSFAGSRRDRTSRRIFLPGPDEASGIAP